MDVNAPRICRVQQVEVGALFVLVGAAKGSPICLRAAYTLSEEEADEANRVIPLHWPEDPQSVGVAIYASALSGHAVVLGDARLEVNPLSARSTELSSLAVVYGQGERLFFPISYNGRWQGLVDAATGEILGNPSGSYVGFEDWHITVGDDALDRLTVLPAEEESEGKV
jgi:hypothetical protein